MLKLDLAELDRQGRLDIEGDLASDLPLWDGLGLELEGPVRVSLNAQATTSGEVLVRGAVKAHLLGECRRCLKPLERRLEEEVTILFSPPDQSALEDQGGEIHVLDPEGNFLDLGAAVREELFLDVPEWVLCEPACKGLCPRCGANWNKNTCDCTLKEPDPRWEALRALTEE